MTPRECSDHHQFHAATAERSLTAASGTEHTERIAHFDEAALAREVALCLLEIGT